MNFGKKIPNDAFARLSVNRASMIRPGTMKAP
jgi:hypothetical protein